MGVLHWSVQPSDLQLHPYKILRQKSVTLLTGTVVPAFQKQVKMLDKVNKNVSVTGPYKRNSLVCFDRSI